NLPFGQIESAIGDMVRNKATPVILVCPTGARAGRAAGLLKKLGYEQAQALSGGLKAWQEANLPIERA
ncbi:MAG: rhodanese-like domain-containing protein, partial [Betaproteobacteria bacterium]|nr:rhodanese-like domain-containing protein [Betaproteobacteria bacterium]